MADSKKCQSFASQANQLIQIQQPTEVADAGGDVTQSWSTIITCYAIITPVKGYEAMMSQQLQSPHSHKVKIRYAAELMPPPAGNKLRVLHGTRTYNITSVRELEEKRFLELVCDEGVAT